MKYKILYQACPIWKVGERDCDAESRRSRLEDLSVSDRYPNDYAGRVISVIPDSKEFAKADLADPSRAVMARDLTGIEVEALRDHRMKVVPYRDGFAFSDVVFDDRWGAVAKTLRDNIADAELCELSDRESDVDALRFDELSILATRMLPKTEVHTGAGLYEVGPGKTYSTIQSALDQLYTDQGSATFTAIQYIRVFPDTYDENLAPSSSLEPRRGYALIIEGDPASNRDSILVQPSGGTWGFLCMNDGPTVIRHMKIDGSSVTSTAIQSTGASEFTGIVDVAAIGNSSYTIIDQAEAMDVLDCEVTSGDAGGIFGSTSGLLHVARTVVKRIGSKGSSLGITIQGGTISGSVIYNFDEAIRYRVDRQFLTLRNNTIYDCTDAVSIQGSPSTLHFFNNIISTVTNVILYPFTDSWPDEGTIGTAGNRMLMRNNIYYSYTNWANDGSTQRTHAQFILLDRVDQSGDLDQTNPLLTDPGNEDFSLGTGSPAINAGHGIEASVDYLGTSFDSNEPDIGAWSSGVLPPPTIPDAPTITAIANDGDGSSATASVLTESGSKVFLLSRERNSAEAWTVRGSRTGSGDIAATGYTNNTNYESIAIATFGTLVTENPSLPSIPVGVYVTDSAGFFAAIRQAIYDWVSGELGIPTIWYQPNAPQPTRPYAALNKGPTQSPRWDFKSPPDSVNGVSTLRGDREFPVEIQIHGRKLPDNENEAMTLAEQLGTSLQKGSIVALFTAANFAFVERIALTDISAIGGTEFESRVSLELMFRMAHEDTDTVGVIETVDPVGATYQ